MERTVHYRLFECLMRFAAGSLLLGGLLMIAGCRSSSVQSEEQQAQDRMASLRADFKQVLDQGVNRYHFDDWVGGLSLRAVINRRNEVVSCTAEALPDYPLQRFPDNRKLAPLLEEICWNMVFPRVGPQLFSNDPGENLQVVIPMVFSPPRSRPMEEQRVRATVREYRDQERYLWRQLFVGERLDSIGIARFHGVVSEQGQIARCQVEWVAIDERLPDFKPDSGLVQRLEARCATLDLQQMSVFLTSLPVGQRFLFELEYTPWKTWSKHSFQ
ncbi:hypothetical protein [Pseudomonas sessilinigenes]|uniref:Lipoprotein n=1 Tax=Pseudomonas sessilinigenes TaxID=658629 RepID=A0ABX8MKP6_9PSED|nr:hypothetical protein [Pseudomonas sessilinigenes]AZC27204.1 hypothetical protein C4K39_5563 [Pseudomonas sessilinigenes]QXH38863.1 hypothetical protein KSS89_21750 [Pseudomonas sessilinigenes]